MTNEEYAALDDISKLKFLRDGLCFDGFVQIGDKILRESTIPKELMPPITEDERDAARYFGRKVEATRPIHIYIDEASQEVFHREKLYVQAVNPHVGDPYVNIGQVKGIHDAEQGKPTPDIIRPTKIAWTDEFPDVGRNVEVYAKPTGVANPNADLHVGLAESVPDAPPIIIGVPADWPITEDVATKTIDAIDDESFNSVLATEPGAQIVPTDAIERAARAGYETTAQNFHWDKAPEHYREYWREAARAVINSYLGRSLEDDGDRPVVGRVCVGVDLGTVGGDVSVISVHCRNCGTKYEESNADLSKPIRCRYCAYRSDPALKAAVEALKEGDS